MSLSARDYARQVRNSVWERELAQELRRHPEHERLEFIADLAFVNSAVALDLARKCLSESKSFEVLLRQALTQADPSGIRYWLMCITPRLGFRKVVRYLREAKVHHPEGVKKAKYWLPLFAECPGFSREAINSI
ncbi:MAG: hypothetical protein ACYC61_17745 [Isosphaeraceae bacterium]